MGLIWPVLLAIGLWALVRLGRQGERAGRGHWRIASTILGAVLVAAGLIAASHGAWLAAGGTVLSGLYLIVSSRIRQAQTPPASPREAHLSEAEARSVLGVAPEASEAEIRAAWRRLMGRVHPDQGGAAGLASHLNAARDRLLKH
jgi:hypothetical protein